MNAIIHEPFIAAFTGQLASFHSELTKQTYAFHKPYPRIVKNQAYMMQLDRANNKISMLPVIG